MPSKKEHEVCAVKMEEHKIYVGNLSFGTDDDSLRNCFEKVVEVQEGKL